MILLTFDTDWMSIDALDKFLGYYSALPTSTFFLHKFTESVPDSHHVFNPHPTLTTLDSNSELDEMESLPRIQRQGIRTHSCVNSHLLSLDWARRGYRYQSIVSDLGNVSNRPYLLPWGIWEMPIYYMDNMSMWAQVNLQGAKMSDLDYLNMALDSDNLCIFDFHPIHIALNTSSTESYGMKKNQIIVEKADPWNLADKDKGIRDFFENVLNACLAQKNSLSTLESYLSEL